MHVHADAFGAIVKATLGPTEAGYRDNARISQEDARAILGIAQLVAGADDKEDAEEVMVLDELTAQITALAGGPLDVPRAYANDDYERLEKIREIGGQLTTPQTRELAYAIAYAVTISDFELAPAETEFLADLAVALGIPDSRTGELAVAVAQAVTPPE
jgi:tellurite resistance protein